MRKVKAVILAGGIGKRMWPLKTNKLLLPFLGSPLLLDNLRRLKEVGINDLIIVTTPDIFTSVKKLAAPLKSPIILQPRPLGQADALLKAAKLIKDQEILIVNANDLFNSNLVKMVLASAKKKKAVIPAVKVRDYFSGGYLQVKQGKIKKIVEKPSSGKEPSNLVKLDVDYFQNANLLLEAIRKVKTQKDDLFEEAINSLIKNGLDISLVEYQGYWGSIKYPWDILKAMDLFFKHRFPKKRSKKPAISRKATIIGSVIFEKGVKIMAGAKVKGPAYIGAGTIIGNNALIRGSMIGKNCVIGYDTEIARSYLGNNCWFHSNYVGDSVLGDNVSLGAGAVLANLRFDERTVRSEVKREKVATGLEKLGAIIGDKVKVGINASVMPGIKIGANSFVGPGVIVERDLPENKFCRLKQSLVIRKNKRSLLLGSEIREKARQKIQ
jgi:NDP-sugar pyrophosphorylase family protein